MFFFIFDSAIANSLARHVFGRILPNTTTLRASKNRVLFGGNHDIGNSLIGVHVQHLNS